MVTYNRLRRKYTSSVDGWHDPTKHNNDDMDEFLDGLFEKGCGEGGIWMLTRLMKGRMKVEPKSKGEEVTQI